MGLGQKFLIRAGQPPLGLENLPLKCQFFPLRIKKSHRVIKKYLKPRRVGPLIIVGQRRLGLGRVRVHL